jgi:hypothetical protein
MAEQRRIGARAAKSSYDQKIRTLEEELEAIDEQLADLESRRIVQEHTDHPEKLRRKMH